MENSRLALAIGVIMVILIVGLTLIGFDTTTVQRIKIQNNQTMLVDISDAACMKFGFKHGDRILTPNGNTTTVVGVGPYRNLGEVLWYTKDTDEGPAVHCWTQNNGNAYLPAAGFKKIKK